MMDFSETPNAVNESSDLGVVCSFNNSGVSTDVSNMPVSCQNSSLASSRNEQKKEALAIEAADIPRYWLKPPAPLSQLDSLLLRAQITATALTVSGAKDYSFLVTLPEQVNIGLTDLGTGEVVVTGPNGYCQVANFVVLRGRIICYRINAPDGTWTQADNGVYRIHIGGDETVTFGMMWSFQVKITDDDSCLIQNGSFEHGLTHWVTFAGTEQVAETDAYIGMAALVLSTMDSGTSQNIGVKPGDIYQLTGYGSSTSQNYSSFGMTFFDAKGSLLSRSDVGTIYSARWQDYFVVEIAPTHAAYVQVWTYQSSDQGTTLIDGLSLRKITEDNLPPVQVSQFSLINAPLAATDTTFG